MAKNSVWANCCFRAVNAMRCFRNSLLASGEAVFVLQNRCFSVGFCSAEPPYFIFLLSAEALPSCLFRGFQGLAGVLLCCACCHGAPRCRLIAARNILAVSAVAALRNFTEPPVNFLRLPCSIATGQLEKVYGGFRKLPKSKNRARPAAARFCCDVAAVSASEPA